MSNTPQKNFRFTPETLEMIKRIQAHYGNELTISAAIVIAITHECERIEAIEHEHRRWIIAHPAQPKP